jgi:hypothetical protein
LQDSRHPQQIERWIEHRRGLHNAPQPNNLAAAGCHLCAFFEFFLAPVLWSEWAGRLCFCGQVIKATLCSLDGLKSLREFVREVSEVEASPCLSKLGLLIQ